MRKFKKTVISLSILLAIVLTPGMSLALSDHIEFNVSSKAILAGYAKLALQEFYLYGPFQEKKLPATLNFNNPVLYTFRSRTVSDSIDNLAAIIYQDTGSSKSYHYVLLKIQDGMVIEILSRSSVYTDNIFNDIKTSANEMGEF